MIIKNRSRWWTEFKPGLALPLIISCLAFANLSPVTVNAQDNDVPKGWYFGADRRDYKTGLDDRISQHGQNSATIESKVEHPANFSTLLQSMLVKELSGKRVKMTGFIKSQGVSDTASMWIRVDDFGNKIVADFDNMMDRPLVGNNDWTKREIIFDVPEKCVIFYGFLFKGSGKIWVDNVSFEVVSNDVNKTANNLGQPFPQEYMDQLKENPDGFPEKPPANLDFEEKLAAPALSAIETDLPKTDLHVHLNFADQSPENGAAAAYVNASALSKKMGVTFGIAEEFDGNSIRINDSLLLDRIALAKKNSLYLGLQVSRRDWHDMYSKGTLAQVDYILADGMIFPNKAGKMLYIWVPGTPLGEPEDFMNLYVAHNVRVLSEPITIWGNATYLPDALISRYDELWTDARMKILIDAAVKNNVAIEINSRFKVPNAKFIKMAKAAGAHFTFGSNTHGPGAGEISWSINMAKECGLTKDDFFVPKRKL
jgi:hypothetical protein